MSILVTSGSAPHLYASGYARLKCNRRHWPASSPPKPDRRLHTWGQTLTHHPHVHCLVPGGGVALDNKRWVEAKPNFLLSVHALSKAFRRLFLDGLKAEVREKES